MDEEDVIQKPLSEILFRQCSIETRLSPSPYSEEEFFNETKNDAPKIVECKRKPLNITDKPLISPKRKITPPNFGTINAVEKAEKEETNEERNVRSSTSAVKNNQFLKQLNKTLAGNSMGRDDVTQERPFGNTLPSNEITQDLVKSNDDDKNVKNSNEDFRNELIKKIGVGFNRDKKLDSAPNKYETIKETVDDSQYEGPEQSTGLLRVFSKMDEEDVIQKPLSEILFRQCSIETRLSPSPYSEEEFFNETKNDAPKIVECKRKPLNITDKPLISPKRKITPPNFGTINAVEKAEKEETNEERNVRSSTSAVKNNQFLKQLNKTLAGNSMGRDDVTQERPFGNTLPSNEITQDLVKSNDDDKNVKNSNEDFRNELIKKIGVGFNRDKKLDSAPNKYETIKETVDDSQYEGPEQSTGLLRALFKNKEKERAHERDGDDYNRVGGVYKKKEDMATLRPKSPRPVPLKGEKEETIWDKIGTLGRKKRIKEVQEVQAEGKYAIDSPGCPTAPIIPPEDYNLDDNEERCMIEPRAYDDPKFYELLNVLKEWINDELASQRIIVQDLSEDLYDGQVLQKLLEKLTGDKFDVPEVTQSEEGQKQKLMVVLDHFNKVLGIQKISHNKWNVESIHSKNIVAITHLLVALARHFRPPVRLPEHVSVEVVVVQKANGRLIHKTVRESLTKAYDDVGMRCERDAFDTLFDHAPEKLQVVKKSLVTFVNKHLNKMNFEVTEIESQFHDGVYLIMLMGLLEGFFVPHYSFHLTPHEFEQKVHNVTFAFELMEEVGLQKPKARPEDVVNMDLKSTLRVLYNLFLRYRTIL